MQLRHRSEKCLGGAEGGKVLCPFCYENRKQRANHKGHRYFIHARIRVATFEEMTMKRPSQVQRPKKGEFVCPDAAFQSNYPNLAAGLCDAWWDDGKPREPWKISFSMREDAVLFSIADKDAKLICFTSAEGLTEGLMAIEAALAGEGLAWRKMKW